MELSHVQSGLTSLEDRFRELRILGEQQLQDHENTIANLQQQLSQAIAQQQAAEKLHEIDRLKLQQRIDEISYLRIRCEVLLQQTKETELLKQKVQRLEDHLEQVKLEDQGLFSELKQSTRVNIDLNEELTQANKLNSFLATLLNHKQHLLAKLFELNQRLYSWQDTQSFRGKGSKQQRSTNKQSLFVKAADGLPTQPQKQSATSSS